VAITTKDARRASIDRPLLYARSGWAVNDSKSHRSTGLGFSYDGRALASSRAKRVRLGAAAFLVVLAALLLVPDLAPETPPPAAAEPFVWDEDARWEALEARFEAARSDGCDATTGALDEQLAALAAEIQWAEEGRHPPSHPNFDALERRLFETAPLVGACPERTSELIDAVRALRVAMKTQSRSWDLSRVDARRRVYRLLYGSRTAVEELLLQSDPDDVPALVLGTEEPSETPSAMLGDVEVHSGDILVSRGGAPTSALIARGNDYPGNFSHIALLHVDDSGTARVIEAHIEVGVTISSLDTYLEDKKLRIMVLRLDHTLGPMRSDPMLPHRAATAALEEAEARHIPYDFAMRYDDPTEKFCSEVASAPYGDLDVHLWEGLTSMSSLGVTAWLSGFGVEEFVTHGPSDLEYDPKVVVVAEWRDPETLFDDHVDNAVIDAMLEGAERGDELDYQYSMLPMARLAKAYSSLLNVFGEAGPVPEGMSATRALRAQWLDARHAAIKAGTLARVDAFRDEHGYTPPYWELVAMARDALAESDS